ncbi:MAG: stage V sporulation protein AE [bacterium]|jgi:stage V sporulation protein AE
MAELQPGFGSGNVPEKEKIRVILLTDGDRVAGRAAQRVAKELGLRCISASVGNPTPRTGEELVRLVRQVPYEPVLVMFDDRGNRGRGKGEKALECLARHPGIAVLGAVAVASNTEGVGGVKPAYSVTRDGTLTGEAVDKFGKLSPGNGGVIRGDTVDILNRLDIPIIIGIGDLGKMDDADQVERGAPITRKAIEAILAHSCRE